MLSPPVGHRDHLEALLRTLVPGRFGRDALGTCLRTSVEVFMVYLPM